MASDTSSDDGRASGLCSAIEAYRRLASMDPPAMRSLVTELNQMSRESAASAVHTATVEAASRANRTAQRAAAAQAALDRVEAENRREASH